MTHTVVVTIDGGKQRPETWITSNQRLHPQQRAARTREWRARARSAAQEQAAGVAFGRAHIVAHLYRPTDTRRYDPGNWYPTAKACVDGLVDTHVLPDDDWRHLDGPDMRHGGIDKERAIITLTITDLGDPL